VAKFCDGIEKLDDSANSAIWELSDHFGCYAVAARVFFRVWLIFDDVNDFVWAKLNSLILKLRYGKVGKVNAVVTGFAACRLLDF